jgi:SAM-dependent methyltransferase
VSYVRKNLAVTAWAVAFAIVSVTGPASASTGSLELERTRGKFSCGDWLGSVAYPFVWLFRAGSTEGRLVNYPHGVSVEEQVSWFGAKRRIVVTYPDGSQVDFNRTNRTLSQLHGDQFYPEQFLLPAYLKGKKVLDFGCADGRVVEDFRREGIDAHGLDIYIRPADRKKPYLAMADGGKTALPSETFDVVMSTWSAFSYLTFEASKGHAGAEESAAEILGEMIRLTKVGGVIRLSPVMYRRVGSSVDYPALEKMLADRFRNVRIKSRPDAAWLASYHYQETHSPNVEGHRMPAEVWVELERVR